MVKEQASGQYAQTESTGLVDKGNDSYEITFTNQAYARIFGRKNWDDNNDAAKKRPTTPDQVNIVLYQAENQGAILESFSYRSGGTNIALCDESGNAIVVFTPKKDYQCAVITAPEIQQGKTYKLYAAVEVSEADKNGFARNISCTGGTHIADITMDSLIYGKGGFAPGGPGGGDHGGGPGGKPGSKPGRP